MNEYLLKSAFQNAKNLNFYKRKLVNRSYFTQAKDYLKIFLTIENII